MAHKRNLKKSTRIDEENKKTELLEFLFFFINCAWLYRFIWNCIKQTGLWNLNHRKFKILSQQWQWNYTKTVSQLIVIKFAKSLPNYRIFFAKLHTGRISFIIFFVLGILMYFFFLLFYNTLKNSNPEFQRFPVSKEISINRNS